MIHNYFAFRLVTERNVKSSPSHLHLLKIFFMKLTGTYAVHGCNYKLLCLSIVSPMRYAGNEAGIDLSIRCWFVNINNHIPIGLFKMKYS